jgi:hypothetical protein
MGIGFYLPFTILFIYFLLGTHPLRKYGYSHIGTPVVLEIKQLLGKNLTLTATISLNGPEFF